MTQDDTNRPVSQSNVNQANQTAVAEADRRAQPRVPVCVEVEIMDTRTGVQITGRATDFGVGGCYVDTMNTFAQGTAVEVRLLWQSRTLKVRAIVSYAVHGRSIGMGLSFIGVSPEAGATLLDWVTGLSNEPPPQSAPKSAPPPRAMEQTAKDAAAPPRIDDVVGLLVRMLVARRVLNDKEGQQLSDALVALRWRTRHGQGG